MSTSQPPRRSAMVTGAARGIGRAIARRLEADGLMVSVSDLASAAAELEELSAGLTRQGTGAIALSLNVADPTRSTPQYRHTSDTSAASM
ncbi:SDR family NAD(P)-dependent oxidoreductase [Actinoplanes sp. NPDC051470]|uniref:SDR family NAD(P)-dependent oxidoreductase n=1 Tax=Actinoplanes sp. NPDC051470 TaxID=3157224 RepID=UPI003424AB37